MMKKATYSLFLLVTLMALLEIGLRATGVYQTYTERLGHGYVTFYDVVKPSWYWTYLPNDTFILDHGEFRYDYITNSYGLRERETVWTDTTAIRLMVFGDSFTEGIGADADSSYPKALERRMKEQGFDVSVYNAGSSGGDPFYSHVLLRDKLLEHDPTHVIVTVNRTDFEDHIFRGGYERFQDDGTAAFRKSPPFHETYKKYHVARFYYQMVKGYDNTLIKKNRKSEYLETANTAIKESLDSTYAMCRNHQVKFMVMGHVGPGEVCAEKLNNMILDKLDVWDFDYPYVKIADQFRERINTKDCMDFGWPIDNHYNAVGYDAVAGCLLDAVNEQFFDFFEIATDSVNSQTEYPISE